jgi:hypothetical protein
VYGDGIKESHSPQINAEERRYNEKIITGYLKFCNELIFCFENEMKKSAFISVHQRQNTCV